MQLHLPIRIAALLILQASAKLHSLKQVGRSLQQSGVRGVHRELVAGVFLGDCGGFAVLAETAITFADTTIINDGNVGIGSGNIEAITGVFTAANSGQIVQQSSPVSASCQTAKQHAYDFAATTPGTQPVTIAAGMGGVTFDAGVYHATTLSTAAADIITLRGGPSDIFIFQSASTLVIGANTQIKLIGGACADNVFWSLGSAATIGADSDFIGTVFAGSAITLGKDVVVRGRLFAQTTITFGATNTIYAGVCSATGTDDCAAGYKCGNDEDGFVCEDIDVAAITFDLPLDCSGFAVLAETAITFADTTIINDGNVGIGSGNIEAITGNFTGANSVPIVQQSSPVSASCKTAKQRAYDYTARTPGTKPATIAAGMGGVTFDAGVYHATTLSTAAADIITLRGGPSDIFIFQTDSTIVLGANTKIKLIGGACADNVFWSVGSAATIGADSDFIGTVFAGSAITLGADVVVRGRLYAQTAITFGATNTIEAESGFSGFCSSTAANSS